MHNNFDIWTHCILFILLRRKTDEFDGKTYRSEFGIWSRISTFEFLAVQDFMWLALTPNTRSGTWLDLESQWVISRQFDWIVAETLTKCKESKFLRFNGKNYNFYIQSIPTFKTVVSYWNYIQKTTMSSCAKLLDNAYIEVFERSLTDNIHMLVVKS